jgi:hypothetical protein
VIAPFQRERVEVLAMPFVSAIGSLGMWLTVCEGVRGRPVGRAPSVL